MYKETDKSILDRRAALSKLGVAASIAVWSKPIIELVVLPAHATTTNDLGNLGDDIPASDDDANSSDSDSDSDSGSNESPCECDSPTKYRIKANWVGNDANTGTYIWEVSPGEGANDCIKTGDAKANGAAYGYFSGGSTARGATFVLTSSSCKIVQAAHKAGSGDLRCIVASSEGNCGGSASFVPNDINDKDISHVELIVECCPI